MFTVDRLHRHKLHPTNTSHDTVSRLQGSGRQLVVYSLYDFDRSGEDAERSLREKSKGTGKEAARQAIALGPASFVSLTLFGIIPFLTKTLVKLDVCLLAGDARIFQKMTLSLFQMVRFTVSGVHGRQPLDRVEISESGREGAGCSERQL